jgi:hypothetical protein
MTELTENSATLNAEKVRMLDDLKRLSTDNHVRATAATRGHRSQPLPACVQFAPTSLPLHPPALSRTLVERMCRATG